MPHDAAYTRKLNNRNKIESYTPSNSQPPEPIPQHPRLIEVLSPWGNNIHIHHCSYYLSLPQPPYHGFPVKNGVLIPYRYRKTIYFHHLWMYLTVNFPRHIATLSGSVLLLTASRMIIQLLKCRGSPPHLLMLLHVHKIHRHLLFWQPLIS